MQKVDKIWMDGKLINYDDAQTHVLSHSLHYGSGVFEGLRFYETDKGVSIFRLDEHINRLFKGAEAVWLKIPYSKEQFMQACKDVVKVNNLKKGYIRPLVFFGLGGLGVPAKCPTICVVAAWEWGKYIKTDEGAKLKISKYIRIHPKSSEVDLKICGHYVNSMLAVHEALKAGYDEALLLDFEGNVAECSGENMFAIKNGKIYTPHLGAILPGITRDVVIRLAKDLGYEVIEKAMKPEFLKKADEAFMTGTAAEVTEIGKIDDSVIGDGKIGQITAKLKKEFLDIANCRNEKYKEYWFFV